MALHSTRSLNELKEEAEFLGLQVEPTKKSKQFGLVHSKEDFILALREFNLNKLKSEGQDTKAVELIMNIDSPMLCEQFKKIKPDVQKQIKTDGGNYIYEEKEDGCRMNLMLSKEGHNAFSRNLSVTDFLPISYKNNIRTSNWDFSKIPTDMILDTEIICKDQSVPTKLGMDTETQLQAVTALISMNSEDSLKIQEEVQLEFKVFDILYLEGKWITELPLIERLKLIGKYLPILNEAGIKISRPKTFYKPVEGWANLGVMSKEDFYNHIVSNGGEGVIAKNINSKYATHGRRSHRDWIKIKRTVKESSANLHMSDTIDAYISGFEPGDVSKGWAGLVGALIFSVQLRDKDGNITAHEIAKISNIDLETRKGLSQIVNGEVSLKPEWYGRVASIDGQAVSARARRLKHAILENWRPDRSADTCIMDEDFLNTMIL